MKIVIYALVVTVVLFIGGVMFQKIKKILFNTQNKEKLIANHGISVVDDSADELQICFEMLNDTQQIDQTKLVEIKDSKVLARVDNLVPGILQTLIAAGNAIQGNAQVLYQAVIPVGAKLAQSQDMVGAVRGFYHGAEGIIGHANFVKFNNTANIAVNAGASAMSLASMIVGQYYMTQINAELVSLGKRISRIANFQDNEYKSRVFALVTQTKKISSFQAEILENDELRTAEIVNLNNLEQQCIELLGQANLTIACYFTKKNLTFNEYEQMLLEVQSWYIYQKTLLEVLYRIADLKHTLHLGFVSRDQCGALLPTYSKQVKDSITQLNRWHQVQAKKFGIDIGANIRKRVGFDGVVHKLPGLINVKHNFRPISVRTSDIIATQVSDYEIPSKMERGDLFHEDVRLIAKEGKLYYLPEK
nr:hypothetical protein [Clostridium paraputrificum]